MLQETLSQSYLKFSIAVHLNPYKQEPYPVPHNYKHMLADSDLMDLKVSNDGDKYIPFVVKFDEPLSPQTCTGRFTHSGHQQRSFNIKLGNTVELQGPIGELSIGETEYSYHTLSLIKVALR